MGSIAIISIAGIWNATKRKNKESLNEGIVIIKGKLKF